MSQLTKALITSSLRIKPEEVVPMVQWLADTRDRVRAEMGFDVQGKPTGWIQKREQYWAEYENDFKHRENHPRYSDLYKLFNNSLNVPKRAIRVFTARACENLLNTDPFTGFVPEGPEDEDPGVMAGERYWHRKLSDAQMRFALREGTHQAAVSGEAVMKTVMRPCEKEDEDETPKAEPVWLDETGEPLVDSAGGFIYESDEWEDVENALDQQVLKRDANIITRKGSLTLTEETIPRPPSDEKLELDVQGLSYKDFLCSPTARDIHTTDFIAHDYDLTFNDLLKMIGDRPLTSEGKSWLREILNGRGDSPQGSSEPVERRQEKSGDEAGPCKAHENNTGVKIRVCEAWYSYSHDPFKPAEEYCCLFHPASKTPIFYERAKAQSPTKKRPFRVVRIIPVADRWYGMGFYELLSNEHEFIDLQWSRINARSGTSGRFTWMREGAIKEVNLGIVSHVQIGSPRIWTADRSLPPDVKPIEHLELPALDANIWNMLNHAIQQAQLMSGTMLPGDSAVSGLNQSETLGEQQMLAAESELMSNDSIQDLTRGLVEVLKDTVTAVFQHFNPAEAGGMLGVNDASALQAWLKQNKASKLLNNVRLLLTKTRSKQQLEANQQASQIIREWIDVVGGLPTAMKDMLPLYRGMLESIDVPNAKQLLESVAAAVIQRIQQEQAMAAANAAAQQQSNASTTKQPAPQAPPSALPPGSAAAA